MSRNSSLLFLFPKLTFGSQADGSAASFPSTYSASSGVSAVESAPGSLTTPWFFITLLPALSGFLTIDQLSRPCSCRSTLRGLFAACFIAHKSQARWGHLQSPQILTKCNLKLTKIGGSSFFYSIILCDLNVSTLIKETELKQIGGTAALQKEMSHFVNIWRRNRSNRIATISERNSAGATYRVNSN